MFLLLGSWIIGTLIANYIVCLRPDSDGFVWSSLMLILCSRLKFELVITGGLVVIFKGFGPSIGWADLLKRLKSSYYGGNFTLTPTVNFGFVGWFSDYRDYSDSTFWLVIPYPERGSAFTSTRFKLLSGLRYIASFIVSSKYFRPSSSINCPVLSLSV